MMSVPCNGTSIQTPVSIINNVLHNNKCVKLLFDFLDEKMEVTKAN